MRKDFNIHRMKGTVKLDQTLSKIIEAIKAYPEVIAIYLFGSHARGEATPLSDVDIAVILENPTPELEAEIGSFSSPQMDIVLFHRLPLHIKHEVFKYGKEIFVRSEEKLLAIKLDVLREYLDTVRMYRMIYSEVLG